MATNDKTVKLTIITDTTQPETVFKKVTDSAKELEATVNKITSTNLLIKGLPQTAVDVEIATKNLSKFKEVLSNLQTSFGGTSKLSYSIAPSKEELQALRDSIALAKLARQEELQALKDRIAIRKLEKADELQALRDRITYSKLQKEEALKALRERIAERKLELQIQKESEKFKEDSIKVYTAFVEAEAKKQAAIVKENLRKEEEAVKVSYALRLQELTKAFTAENELSSKFSRLSAQAGYTPQTPRNFASSSIIAGMSISGKEVVKKAKKDEEILLEARKRNSEDYKLNVIRLSEFIGNKNEETINKLKKNEEFYTNWINTEYQKRASGYAFAGKADARPVGASAYTGTAGLGGKTATQLQQEQIALEEFEKAFNARMYALGLKTAADRKEVLDKEVADALEANSKLEQAERDRLYSLQKFRDATNAMYSKVTSGQDNRLLIAKIRNDVKEEEVARIEANSKLVALKRRLRRELDIIDANVDATVITGAEGKLQAQTKVNQYKVLIDQVKKLLQNLEVAGAKTSNVTGIQQGVINEFNQRQQLLDKYSKLEVAKREQLVRDLILIEERKNAQLAAIAKSGVSESVIKTTSATALQQYTENRKALLESANAADEAKSKHIDLWQFIGKSMIIWRSYNFILNETRQLMMAIPKVGMELESTKSVLEATMGGTVGTEAALRGLHEEAKRTGIEIKALRETWRTFSASTTIAGESINTSWKIFQNMNTVITSLHYSGDKATHIFMALSQMFNKSKVQSEELVKQLGNLLPGAFAAFAKATGRSTEQLVADMKKGLVTAHDNIEQFTEFYATRFSTAFAIASNSLNANLGRMNTAFTELGESIYRLTSSTMTSFVIRLTQVADKLTELSRNGHTFENALHNISALLATLAGSAVLAGVIKLAGSFEALLGTLAAAGTELGALKLLLRSPWGMIPAMALTFLVGDKVYNSFEESEKDLLDQFARFKVKADDSLKLKPLEIRINESQDVKDLTKLLEKQMGVIGEHQRRLKTLQEGVKVGRGGAGSNIGKGTEAEIRAEAKALADAQEVLMEYDQSLQHLKKSTGDLLSAEDTAASSASEHTIEMQKKLQNLAIADTIKRREDAIRKEHEVYKKAADIELAQAETNLRKQNEAYQKNAEKANLISLVAAQKRVANAYQATLDAGKAELNALNEAQQKVLKSEDNFDKKRLESAKKASEDLLRLTESAASKRMNSVDNELKALEQTKDITSTSAYYNAERALIEKQIEIKKELLKTTKELLGTQQASASTSISGNKLMGGVFNAFSAAGLSEAQAKAITAEVGRENSFQSSVVFGSHVDPYNKATNVGMLSWQKERGKQVADYLQKYGAMQDGKISQSQESLDLMAKFAVEEMTKSNAGKMFLANKDIGEEDAAKLMGKFIGWRRDDPKYAKGKQTVKDYYAQLSGKLSGEGIGSAATELSKVASIEKEIADLEAKKKLTYDQQTASLKTVEEAYAKVTAQYNILTGNIEEGVEQKAAIKYKDALDAVNNALENGNEYEAERARLIKWQVDEISRLELANKRYRDTLKEVALIRSSNDEKLNQINALEQLGLKGNVEAMIERSAVKSANLFQLRRELKVEQAHADTLVGKDGYEAAMLNIQKLQNAIEQLSATSNELLTTTADMIGDAFDKTFRGVQDGSIKAKNAISAFGKSVIGTLQEIIYKELKSQIITMAFKGLGGLFGSFGSTSTFENAGTPFQLASKLPLVSANGNIFNSGNVIPFSKGGIPDIGNNMQYFPLANGGVGSLRENGKYEAIVPLSRDSSGQLGIKADGSLAPSQNNVYNINVNVSGTTDKSNANDVGMQVATAIMVQIADARIANANKLGNQLKPLTAFR